MKSFRDTQGRTWDVEITFGTAIRVKTETGVDLLDLPTTQKCLQDLQDPFLLGQVLYQVCRRQADERSIPPENFWDGFNADVIHDATDALIEETIFFCRKEVRPALQIALERSREADRRTMEMVQARMGRIAEQMDEALESLLTSTDSATSSPASSASTPQPGPSAASSGRRRPSKKSGGATPVH